MTPNVEGNRRADEMLTEDQGVYRRVRLTVRLGGWLTDVGTGQQENADAHDMMRFCLAQAQASHVGHKLLPRGPSVRWQVPSPRLKNAGHAGKESRYTVTRESSPPACDTWFRRRRRAPWSNGTVA